MPLKQVSLLTAQFLLITADHAATKQSPDHGARRSNTQQPLGIRKVQRNTDKLKMVQQDLGLIQELKFKPQTFQTNST